jgi:hypothetical protein
MVVSDVGVVAASGSSNLEVVGGFVTGVVGAVASILALIFAVIFTPRPSNERPITGKKVPTVRFWRPRNYNLALGHLKDFVERWTDHLFDPSNVRGALTEYDLVRFIIQLALTCAANIVPQSLGKATLFRISRIERNKEGEVTRVTVYSSEFDGIFTAEQLINDIHPQRLRDISLIRQGQRRQDYPAALQCVVDNQPIVQSLRQRSSSFDSPERNLGLTHVLALPLRRDFSGAIPDQPVSITVDLHYSRLVGYLVDKFSLHRKTLLRRAAQLRDILRPVSALQTSKFLPPTDASSYPIDLGPAVDEQTESARPPGDGDRASSSPVSDASEAYSERDSDDPPGHYL